MFGGSKLAGRVREFWYVFKNFEGSGQDFDPVWVAPLVFQHQSPPKTLELGETKPTNGFSTLKIAQNRGIPSISSPWDPTYAESMYHLV